MPRFEPGAYYVTNISLGVGSSSKKGTPYLYIKGTVTSLSNGTEWVPVSTPEDRQANLWLSPGAMPISLRQLEPHGFNGDFDNPSLSQEVMQNGLVMYCEHETADGKTYERWGIEQGGGGMENKPVTKDVIRDLNARYKAAKGAPATPAKKPGVPPMPPPPTGDQIPF